MMLPDFIFPPPQESFEQLDVVVCGSAPLQREKIDAGNDLIDTLQAIASGVDRPLRLHVFTDTDLSPLLNSIDLGCEVIAYSIDSTPLLTANGMTSIGQPGRSLQSPWLVWMRDALKTFSVDAVHFICHGHLSGLRGSLLFAQSPTQRSDDFLAGSVGAVELANFLIQIGAWATAFSAPTDNHSLLGLRVLADEIAQTLPGPMMMFDHNKAPYGVLEAGYRFVHSPYPQRPPYHEGGLYLYCQPYLLTRSFQAPTYAQRNLELQDLGRRYARNRAQIKTVLNTYALSDDVQSSQPLTRSKHLSAVTAATERAAEQIQLHYQKLIRDEVVPQKTALRDLSIAMETIQQFRQALGEVERERVGDEAGNPLADKGDAS
ncbi:hypothetical protein LRS56_12570 [Pseudomonas poae]|nr:hypothetical protein LRS56_12570 [Pseudomonas poae]